MSWKKTDLERLKAATITDQLRKSRAPARYGREALLKLLRRHGAHCAQGRQPLAHRGYTQHFRALSPSRKEHPHAD